MDTIKAAQEAAFAAVNGVGEFAAPVGAYSQVLPDKSRAYWVDVYAGPKGPGYIVRERRTLADGTVEWMATDLGPEGRSEPWKAVT